MESSASPQQHSSTMSSPVASVFSRGHTSRSSTSNSSLASSPLPRDSFDLYGPRLGKVTEEPQERDELEGYTLVDRDAEAGMSRLTKSPKLANANTGDEYNHYFNSESTRAMFDHSPFPTESAIEEHGTGRLHSKRQRSADYPTSPISNRFSRVSSSISRRWRNRSGAGPQLSIITHMSAPGSRSGSTASSQLVSPALSAVSRHESCLPPSPIAASLGEALHSTTIAVPCNQADADDNRQATTPLLPPVFDEPGEQGGFVQSPLQSPSMAPSPAVGTSSEIAGFAGLPSPPLSTRPSMVSVCQRSRANTANATPIMDIPPLHLGQEANDPWAQSLGHANYNIHPEPYFPEHPDLSSYTEFRANWDQARTNYAKHLARTIEHNGPTSRVTKLTEEKWAVVDGRWKAYDTSLASLLSQILKKLSDSDTDMQDSQASTVLEKPVSRIIMPEIDEKCGKFPELGDGDIVGPMAVGPPRNLKSTLSTPPASPTRKRNFLKFISDILKGN